MSGASFGDDVGAIVVDIGSWTTKAGYAGQDRPQLDIPSYMGFKNEGKFTCGSERFPNYLCGSNHVTVCQNDMEIINPLKNGSIFDWNALEALLHHIFFNELKIISDEHPFLVTELPLTDSKQRETLSELMFEKFCVTGFYSANPAILSTFAHSKTSALVIDSGHTFTSITPVVDGYALKRQAINVPLAGSYLLEKSHSFLNKHKIEIIPQFMIGSKEPVAENSPPLFKLKENVTFTKSFHDFCTDLEIQKFYTSVLAVSDVPLTDNFHLSPSYHEFSTGYYARFEDERFVIPEQLFNPSSHLDSSVSSLGLNKLILNCIQSCDTEIRSQIISNIIAVGGTTHLAGYMDRLQNSLTSSIPPNYRHRFITSSYPGDRRFSAWVGGSILASLGPFHNLWVSKSEYMESGKKSVDIKCP